MKKVRTVSLVSIERFIRQREAVDNVILKRWPARSATKNAPLAEHVASSITWSERSVFFKSEKVTLNSGYSGIIFGFTVYVKERNNTFLIILIVFR